MKIVQHDLIERFEEIFLEIKAGKFLFNQEFISQLSQRINGEEWYHDVLVRAYFDKVLTKHLPNLCPNKSNPCHIEISN